MPTRRMIAIAIAVLMSLGAACGSQRSADDLAAGDDGDPAAETAGFTDPSSSRVPGVAGPDVPTVPGPVVDGDQQSGSPGATGIPAPAPDVGGPSPQAGAPGSTPTRQAATPGEPIRIGAVGTLSGLGAVQRGTIVAVQAWASWTNDHGGLNGHPIEVFVADDRGDAAQLRAAIKNLVEVHHVIAVVGSATAFSMSQATVDYLDEVRVPMVGGDRLSPLWYQSPMMFPQAAAADAAIWIQMLYVSKVAKKGASVGWLVCREAQQCRDSDAQFPAYARQLGLAAKFNRQVSITQPDFTIECRQAQQAGVEYLILGLDVNAVRRVTTDCRQQGYHPTYLSPQTAASMAGEPEFDRLLFSSATFPWVRDDNPATRRYHEALATHAPDLELSAHSSSGWVSAVLFERAVSASIPAGATPSAAAVLEGLWAIRADDLGGLTAPLSFERNKVAPRRWCYFPMSIRGGRWVAEATTITCQSPA